MRLKTNKRPYEHPQSRRYFRALLCASSLLVFPLVNAQDDQEDELYELSPFSVDASKDTGYRATSTLAGTRLRTNLRDVGSAISVVTKEFLNDTNSKNSEDLLVYTAGTEVAGQGGNFVGGGDASIINDGAHVAPVSNTRVRGLAAADNLRDFFLTDIPWDSYNTNRVDLQRGANSILFGIGSPAGIINSGLNTASFENSNKIELQAASYGSMRAVADFNRELVEGILAFRFSALQDEKKYRQDPAYKDDSRIFAAMQWKPKLFGADGAHSTFKANYETGSIDGINPRLTPPQDAITPWFGAMNQATYDWQDSGQVTDQGHARYSPYVGAAGNRIWDGQVVAFDSVNATSQSLIFAADAKNYPTVPEGEEFRNNDTNGSYKGIVLYSNSSNNLKMPGHTISPYKSRSLTDASVFDFYNNLIEGENRSNTSHFNAHNLTFEQTFLDNKIGFELSYDKQDADWGHRNFLAWDAAAITVDLMNTFVDGSPNPNAGRPMVIGGGGSAGSGLTDRGRESLRATAFGELDFNDVFEDDSLGAKILGRHVFTASFSEQSINKLSRSWNNWYVGSGYAPTAASSVGQASRDATTVTYLGDSLIGASSMKNLHLDRIRARQQAASGTVSQWNTVSQSFENYDLPIVNPNDSSYTDATRPYTQATRTKDLIDSEVFVWQGYLFGGNLIPMIGWRGDTAENFDAGTANKIGGVITNYADSDWRPPTGVGEHGSGANGERLYSNVNGNSTSWSLVGHLPRSIAENLPGGMTFSAFYNESSNFQPDASRKDVLGGNVASPSGETRDYGIMMSAMDGKMHLKINKYETSVSNSTLQGELGNSYLIGAGEAWGQAAAYHLGQDDGIWPGDGNYGTTSVASAFGAGHTLRWQPSNDFLIDSDDASQGFTQSGIDAQYDIQRRSSDDWLANPIPASMQQAWGMADYATGGGSWSMNTVAVTGDTLSKGTEIELSLAPTNGWDIMINASKTDAQRLNIGKAYADWIEDRFVAYQGPLGDMRLWGNGNWALPEGSGGTVADKFNNETYPAYNLALALNGSSVPELREWRFNLITNYKFQEGLLKGSNAGLGYRWQDSNVVGFPLNGTQDGYNVNNRLLGPRDDSVDLWFGYTRKIMDDRVDWRIQLNVRNAFASKKLIPVTVQPDGSYGAYRIPEPRVISLTSTFEF